MNKKQYVFLAVIILFISGGCGESPLLVNGSYQPDDFYVPPPEEGSGRGDLVLDEGLVVYHMPGDIDDFEPAVPTNDSLGRCPESDPDSQRAGKYVINGPVMGTSKLDSGGFTDVLFLYYKDAITTDFGMRARIRITANAGTSTSKGYLFGFFNGEETVDYDGNPYVKFSQTSRAGGMIFRTNDTADSFSASAAIRPYLYNKNSSWGTGSNLSSGNPDWMNTRMSSWKNELIMEVKRSIAGMTLTVFNSKTGALYNTSTPSTVTIPNDDLHGSIAYGQPVYAGIALLGTSVEFSQFKLWTAVKQDDDSGLTVPKDYDELSAGELLMDTPVTEPAYVPVDGVKIGISPQGNSIVNTPPAHPSRPSTSTFPTTLAALGTLQLVPIFEPVWADNTHVEWTLVSWNDGPPGNQLRFIEVPGSNRKKLEADGPGKALILMNSRDPSLPPLSVLETLADWSLELTVNE
jgi:hypothetical protein